MATIVMRAHAASLSDIGDLALGEGAVAPIFYSGSIELLRGSCVITDVQKLVDASQQLAQNLNSLAAPKTQSGAQAKQQLETFSSDLQTTTNKAKQTLATVPENAGLVETAKQLAPLAPDLQSLAAGAKSTVQSIEASSSDLKQGFDQADSCKQLR